MLDLAQFFDADDDSITDTGTDENNFLDGESLSDLKFSRQEPLAGKEHIVAVVGSRSYLDMDAVCIYVRSLPPGTLVVSGGADGVDKRAVATASACGLEVMEYTVAEEQRLDPKATFGQCAYRRNCKIVGVSGKLAAFWDGDSRGTRMAIDIATRKAVPVEIIYPRSKESKEAKQESFKQEVKHGDRAMVVNGKDKGGALDHAIIHFISSRKKAEAEFENWEWSDYTDRVGTITDAYCTVRHFHPRLEKVEVCTYNFLEERDKCSCESQFYNPQSQCKHFQIRELRQFVRGKGIDPGSEQGKAMVREYLERSEG